MHNGSSKNSVGKMTTPPPATSQWRPTHPPYPGRRPRIWAAMALALAIVLGAGALIVALAALTRPANNSGIPTSTATATPAYTPAETAAAHQKLCDVYNLAARAVQIQTNTDNQALAVAAGVNAAMMLEQAVNAAPALSASDRTAALALAEAYTNGNAMGSFTHRDDPAWQLVVKDVNTKDARMKTVCGVS